MGALKRILVPLDFTPKNEEAMRLTEQLATPGETKVVLLHVVESLAHTEDQSLADFYTRLVANARQALEPYAARLRDAGIEVDTAVVVDRPARRIVSEACVQGADLVIVSSHPLGQSAGPTERWATVSYQVALFCRRPVLLVK
ncbi:universal stress protein [Botrimarina sp.]|uniref:universal stress protein n=1 Tax=Botrimarina sp. TaxID=2795802 RepID=UPI0032ED87AC